jgi:uncharacterized protein (DUF2252 family)
MTNDVADILRTYNAGREPERLRLKYVSMRTNPFVFLRGTAHLFFQRLDEMGAMPAGPTAVCCGDLHLENFGTYLGENGLTYFDVNDYDEAALAPAAVDILRFVTSILVAGPVIGLKRSEALAHGKMAIDAYRDELRRGKARWIELRTSDGLIGELMNGLKHRDPVKFLDKRTVVKKGVRRLQVDGERALPVTTSERKSLQAFVAKLATSESDAAGFKFVDAARRIAGTGSLGLARYVILVETSKASEGHLLLDLKAARPSALVPHVREQQPKWDGDAVRIVALQSHAQAVSPKLLRAVTFGGRPFVLKEMQPSADRLKLEQATGEPKALARAIVSKAELSAWGHLRGSGRNGAANADDLSAYATDTKPLDALLKLARNCEAAVLSDYDAYVKSFDDGAFGKAAK